MHHFDSQLVSRVKVVSESDSRIEFAGHYRYGDGWSFPFTGFAMAFLAILLGSGGLIFLGVSVILFAGSLALFVYQKRITFDFIEHRILVVTRKISGINRQSYSINDTRLIVERIHIRLAENCGALDLVTPSETIRLSVDGKYEWSLEKANRIRARSNIHVIAAA